MWEKVKLGGLFAVGVPMLLGVLGVGLLVCGSLLYGSVTALFVGIRDTNYSRLFNHSATTFGHWAVVAFVFTIVRACVLSSREKQTKPDPFIDTLRGKVYTYLSAIGIVLLLSMMSAMNLGTHYDQTEDTTVYDFTPSRQQQAQRGAEYFVTLLVPALFGIAVAYKDPADGRQQAIKRALAEAEAGQR